MNLATGQRQFIRNGKGAIMGQMAKAGKAHWRFTNRNAANGRAISAL